MSDRSPKIMDLVLLGGGHSHAIVLKLWSLNPLPNVRLTLISDTTHAPYSGMLPAHVAGFYSYDETHIDLLRLAQSVQAQFYLDRAVGLAIDRQKVICEKLSSIYYDYLSIDIGSTPSSGNVSGVLEYTLPVKPVANFLQIWHQIIEQVQKNPQQPMIISIVGGGAGGVELAFNIKSRLQKLLDDENLLDIHLFHRGEKLLESHSASVSHLAYKLLLRKNIQLHLRESVHQVLPQRIICKSGLSVATDYIFWVTHASAPSWIEASGMATDGRGFILINNFLQSVSHPNIFAAGDIATMQNHLRPKAGVFAVRQGKPLLENLQRIILGKDLKSYLPQKDYLSLIGTGDRQAIASWRGLVWHSPLLWRWKDWIDRQFMQSFNPKKYLLLLIIFTDKFY